ncbi:MAG: polynucleotide adenylyltransferase [Bacteroides sp.]|nr:polynucleotide adenylyltransferase [Bacteroides sp.]
MTDIKFSEYAERLMERLESNGFEAYGVGGCVRNPLMGLPASDYDITTSALPEETERVFGDMKIVETGLKHGTVTVVSEEGSAEITTFRTDGQYKDRRHPENVIFTRSLEEDLARRDFTVNAVAYSQKRGIVDLYGGIDDLSKRILRCVGDAGRRFEEDALRIMRGLRFMSVYGFVPDGETDAALHEKKELLKEISAERLCSELSKLLCGKSEHLSRVLSEYADIFSVIIPEISDSRGFDQHTHYHDRDVWEHTVAAVCGIEPKVHLRLTMLFHDLGKPFCYQFYNGEGHFKGHASVSGDICGRTLARLHYDGDTVSKTVFLVERHDMAMNDDPVMIKKHLNRFGKELYFDLLKVHIADDNAKAPIARARIKTYGSAEETAEKILSEKECFSLKNLAVNGNDMIRSGFKGAEIGERLDFLLNAVIEGNCPNSREELLKYSVNFKK